MDPDAITIIEADGLFLEFLPISPDGLYAPEQAALSRTFVSYARKHGLEGEGLSSIRAAVDKKYATKAERTGVVVQALDILLKEPEMDPYNKRVVEKAKAALQARRD